tara:strand:+ start:761 stop:1828 length:1068 start_codon:yes stop_codon:yes gene_type:complete
MNLFSATYLFLIACVGMLNASTIKIGMSAPLTGPSQQLGISLLEGIRPTIIHINNNGGINGKKIELIVLDDQYIPEKTIKNTHSFIKNNNVDLLFSYVGTPTTHQAAPLLIKHNKLLFFPFTGAQTLHQDLIGEHILHWRPNYWEESQVIIDALMRKKKKRIAVYFQKDTFGQSGLLGIQKALAEQSLAPVSIASYQRGKTIDADFSSSAKLLLAQRPDAIICISSYEASAGIIKAIRKNSDIPIATISFSDPISLIALLKTTPKALNNLIYSQVIPHENDIEDIDQYKTITNQSFTPIRYEGYKNTMTLARLLSNHSLEDIQKNHTDIETQLNKKHTVTLLTWKTNHWVPYERI